MGKGSSCINRSSSMSQSNFCCSAEAHQLPEGCGCRWSSCGTSTDRQNCDLTAGNTHEIIRLEEKKQQPGNERLEMVGVADVETVHLTQMGGIILCHTETSFC